MTRSLVTSPGEGKENTPFRELGEEFIAMCVQGPPSNDNKKTFLNRLLQGISDQGKVTKFIKFQPNLFRRE